MTVPSVSKIGLPGPQSVGSRTGGWCVSNCHGELVAKAGVALRIVESFFGGRGVNLGKDCALANCATASNINPTTILLSWMHGFMFFFVFAPAELISRMRPPEKAKHTAGNVPA